MIDEENHDKRIFYKKRTLAWAVANELQRKYTEQGCYSAAAQFTPDQGWIVVLFSNRNIPDAWDDGAEVSQPHVLPTRGTPSDWHEKRVAKPAVAATVATGGAKATVGEGPTRGKTLQAWQLFDSMPTASRKERIEAGVALGLNKNMLGTQHSRWAKTK